jgi:hypothetical protein
LPALKTTSKLLYCLLVTIIITPLLAATDPGNSVAAGNKPIVKTREYRILFGDKTMASRHVTPKMIDDELTAFRNEPKESDLGLIGIDLEILSFTGKRVDRRTILKLWLRIIDTINRILELPKKKVNRCFSGNFGAGKAEAMERLRREHEEFCKTMEYEEYSPLQSACAACIKDYITDASKYIRMKYTSKKRDVEEVYQLIEANLSSKERREQLEVLLQTK